MTAQTGIAGLGDSPQPRLAAAAELPRRQANPGHDLSVVLEVVTVTDAGQQGVGRNRSSTLPLHQAFAARFVAHCLADEPVVLLDPLIE